MPHSPVLGVTAALSSPHALAREMVVDVEHPTAGPIPLIANPIRLSETPIEYRAAPPLLGQHTREILSGLLAMDDADIDKLARERII